MKGSTLVRLILSGAIAFLFYFAWAYYANSLVTNETSIILKAAFVQGTYSGLATLIFTALLELSFKKYAHKEFCLAFIMPRISHEGLSDDQCSSRQTFMDSIRLSRKKYSGSAIPGALLSPLPALFVQSVLVITVNLIFATPNLWLTVAPSILFSLIYGYSYSISLAKAGKNAICGDS